MTLRIGGLLVAAAIVAASGFVALAGTFWGFTLRCDDTCGTPPPWRGDPNAWQWDALGWTAIAVFACAVLFLGSLAVRKTILSVGMLALWTLAAGSCLVLFRDAGLTSNAARGWVGIAVCVSAGAAAVAASTPRGRS